MAAEFDLAQTFYVDKDAVRQADTIFITSVDLFFKEKPAAGKTQTGIYKPGISVHICPVDEVEPQIEQVFPEVARVEYDSINISSTGALSTNFKFNFPVVIKTARTYAFLIKIDGSDNEFKLWWNKAGEKILNTTTNTQVSSGKVDGFFYKITNGKVLTPLRDADLKFELKIARFTSMSETFKLHNSGNEFFKYSADSITGNFLGGEYVWQNTTPSTGNVAINANTTAIVGTGTSFSSTLGVGDKFVLTDQTTGNSIVRSVASIANNTYMTVDVAPSFSNATGKYIKTAVGTVYAFNSMTERLTLDESTANSTVYFANNAYVYGVDSGAGCRIDYIEDFEANYIRPSYNILTPAGTSTNTSINIANTTYSQTSLTKQRAENGNVVFVDTYPAAFASRSYEVLNSATLFDDSKTFESELTFSTSNIYTSPYAKEENLDVYVTRYEVNNDATNEHKAYGNATSKYISKRVVLAEGQEAEDLRVYISAYKPANTNILIYAKLQNVADSEAFDDKDWTKLELVTDKNFLSNPFNRNDVIELEYKIPLAQTGTAIDGLYATQSSCTVITCTGAVVNNFIVENDIVKLYQPNFPNNHIISVVTASNTSTLSIADTISNSSMVATGLKLEKIDEPNSGYINIQNSNIVRYYNSTYAAFDGYKTFAIKIVLLSDTDYRVPHVNDLRAIAVTA